MSQVIGIKLIIGLVLVNCLLLRTCQAIKCFQCSSDDTDEQQLIHSGSGPRVRSASDTCGAYAAFDTQRNTAVDCAGEEAVSPGTFCYKSIQQGPRGFIWDGRWRTVVRRCAQVSERGISWGCDWGYHENGVYWEECYCAEDYCNGAFSTLQKTSTFGGALMAAISIYIANKVTM